MNPARPITSKPQLALQSYLDGLLQEATETFEAVEAAPAPVDEPAATDDGFAAAVREEQARDAQRQQAAPAPQPVLSVVMSEAMAPASPPIVPQAPAAEPVAPLVDVHLPAPGAPRPPATVDGRPAWAAEPFECLLFDVAGLTLAVPLVCLGSIYSLAGQELTPLFGQPDWFLGILSCQAGNLKVLDTARWVMPERYREDFRQGLQYVISVQGYEWGLAVHQVSRSLRLDPAEIKWRSQRGQRPWLAGTVIEHMCALLDVAELAELIASGAVKQLHAKPQ
ncbi:chemotaxis protein CheW [Pseudomonas guariconensis]|uniref:CheW domain-containing protein n=1 Tax=Pseudomonas TaxID=286 RepID=UPI001CE3E53A|nr:MULTISPECIES: chemotaxis protein CheW [Pseudomonas]MCO7642349.1 chemotaxis protein CheW [Pseudomonas sp. S 311-6]MCO7517170.1 chemotaxis protein CheW [Pseudomonas putida]MCO7567342.1 chemotaxis protein CheW [Pseudomonas mosselii]MCO7597204.1 chemotaxis protein CheW [Pseudomonas guariconensis]MCO7607491.1 chemotaxis protein CheW [Pseudomonas guariconensis]